MKRLTCAAIIMCLMGTIYSVDAQAFFGFHVNSINSLIKKYDDEKSDDFSRKDMKAKVSHQIAKKDRKTIIHDYEILNQYNFSETADQRTLDILELKDLNFSSIQDWLDKRIRYFVPDLEVHDFTIKVLEKDYQYQNPNKFPILETASIGSKKASAHLISNHGSALYYTTKLSKILVLYKHSFSFFSGNTKIPVLSPRVGLIKVSPYFFSKRFDLNRRDIKAQANSIRRLSAYFHEARHSDGNAHSLGFFHAVCPLGHDFEGQLACDRNLNGPYAVGATITKELIKNCDDKCSASDKEQLMLNLLDSESRIIKETEKLIPSRYSPEMKDILTELSHNELALQNVYRSSFFIDAPQRLDEVKQLRIELREAAIEAGAYSIKLSEYWDTTPEGEIKD